MANDRESGAEDDAVVASGDTEVQTEMTSDPRASSTFVLAPTFSEVRRQNDEEVRTIREKSKATGGDEITLTKDDFEIEDLNEKQAIQCCHAVTFDMLFQTAVAWFTFWLGYNVVYKDTDVSIEDRPSWWVRRGKILMALGCGAVAVILLFWLYEFQKLCKIGCETTTYRECCFQCCQRFRKRTRVSQTAILLLLCLSVDCPGIVLTGFIGQHLGFSDTIQNLCYITFTLTSVHMFYSALAHLIRVARPWMAERQVFKSAEDENCCKACLPPCCCMIAPLALVSVSWAGGFAAIIYLWEDPSLLR